MKIWMISSKLKSLENLRVLIGVTQAVKQEIKRREDGFLGASLAPFAATVKQPVISSVVKGVTGIRVIRAGRGCNMGKKF